MRFFPANRTKMTKINEIVALYVRQMTKFNEILALYVSGETNRAKSVLYAIWLNAILLNSAGGDIY